MPTLVKPLSPSNLLLLLLVLPACSGGGSTALETVELDAGRIDAAEVHFADSYCRRQEGAPTGELVAFVNQRRRGWQPFWGEALEPQVEVHFVSAGEPVGWIGLASGQLLGRVEGRPVFQQLDRSEAGRFLELVGGPPIGEPLRPCRSDRGGRKVPPKLPPPPTDATLQATSPPLAGRGSKAPFALSLAFVYRKISQFW